MTRYLMSVYQPGTGQRPPDDVLARISADLEEIHADLRAAGAWVFVVTPDGKQAEKRNVRLGRRNQQSIEVLDGLQAGERVLTSPYTGLTDKDRLEIESK